jgi:hypothetical protein
MEGLTQTKLDLTRPILTEIEEHIYNDFTRLYYLARIEPPALIC